MGVFLKRLLLPVVVLGLTGQASAQPGPSEVAPAEAVPLDAAPLEEAPPVPVPAEPPSAEPVPVEPGPAEPVPPDAQPVAGEPDQIAASCLTELERVQEALDEDDQGRAMVLLDMAGDPCAEARRTLLAAAEAEPAGAEALAALWLMELRRVHLYDAMGQCEQARSTLGAVSADVELPEALYSAFAPVAFSSLRCGPRPGDPSGGTVTMGPGVPDMILSGTAMGEQDASMLSGECWGNIPITPHYSLEVTEDMDLAITAMSPSGGDLVLYVSGPGGVYCNDDWDGLNPGLTGYFPAGTYEVYVGEFSSGGWGTDFSLTISADALAARFLYPTYGSATVGMGYGRTMQSGTAWGVRDAAVDIDPSCSGWIAENPDFQLYVEGTTETWIAVTGSAHNDLTLAVVGPGGPFCVDDTHGTNPTVHETFDAGTYNIWVGDKSGTSTGASYAIQFSPYDPFTILETEPTFGVATLSPATPTVTLNGAASGGLPTSDFFDTSCPGQIATAPSHRLVVAEDAMVEVIARATYGGDLIIALSGPAGSFCNDDYEGLNPGVRRWLTAGEYAVYVGPLSTGSDGTAFSTSFSIVEGTPPVDLSAVTSGLFGNASIGGSYESITLAGTSGGPARADAFDTSCRGNITEAPSFILDVSTGTTVSIEVMAEGDTTLVVNGVDGPFCNDDNVGVNPGMEQYLSPGRYGVWVGSYSEGVSHPFMITFRSSYY